MTLNRIILTVLLTLGVIPSAFGISDYIKCSGETQNTIERDLDTDINAAMTKYPELRDIYDKYTNKPLDFAYEARFELGGQMYC